MKTVNSVNLPFTVNSIFMTGVREFRPHFLHRALDLNEESSPHLLDFVEQTVSHWTFLKTFFRF